MTNNRFCIERKSGVIENVFLLNDKEEILFEDLMNMDFQQMMEYKNIEDFVICAMDAVNEAMGINDDETCITLVDEETYVTLVDSDGVFIWSVVIGPGENEGEIRYNGIDWRKDGKTFRYSNAPEENFEKPLDNEDAE